MKISKSYISLNEIELDILKKLNRDKIKITGLPVNWKRFVSKVKKHKEK